jgi:hypothetical protein
MKQISVILNLVLIGIILFMSCSKRDAAVDNLADEEMAAALRTPCNPCTDHTTTPFEGLTATLAKSMFADYRNLNQPLLQIAPGIPDANRIWFSLESLKNFIWKIEQEVCKRPCAKPLKLGVRIYYARYPNSMTHPELVGLPEEYANHHTLFIVPTYQDETNSNINWDFDPWHWGTDPCKPTTMAQLLGPTSLIPPGKKSLIFTIKENQYYKSATGALVQMGIMNHGNMSPPPVPGNVDGSGL